jgi:predicted transcriptional regulator
METGDILTELSAAVSSFLKGETSKAEVDKIMKKAEELQAKYKKAMAELQAAIRNKKKSISDQKLPKERIHSPCLKR